MQAHRSNADALIRCTAEAAAGRKVKRFSLERASATGCACRLPYRDLLSSCSDRFVNCKLHMTSAMMHYTWVESAKAPCHVRSKNLMPFFQMAPSDGVGQSQCMLHCYWRTVL